MVFGFRGIAFGLSPSLRFPSVLPRGALLMLSLLGSSALSCPSSSSVPRSLSWRWFYLVMSLGGLLYLLPCSFFRCLLSRRLRRSGSVSYGSVGLFPSSPFPSWAPAVLLFHRLTTSVSCFSFGWEVFSPLPCPGFPGVLSSVHCAHLAFLLLALALRCLLLLVLLSWLPSSLPRFSGVGSVPVREPS